MAVGGAPGSPAEIDAAKSALRTAILAARRALSPDTLAGHADAIRDRALKELPSAPTVALYASTGAEPGTRPLLEALHGAGVRVLLPALRADGQLDWAAYEGPDRLVPGALGTVEPAGPRLGPAAVAAAPLVLLPGLAADRRGHRLGRGGGYYDRTLGHADPAALLVVVLHPGETVAEVPVRGHDVTVHAVLSPDGLERLGAAS